MAEFKVCLKTRVRLRPGLRQSTLGKYSKKFQVNQELLTYSELNGRTNLVEKVLEAAVQLVLFVRGNPHVAWQLVP